MNSTTALPTFIIDLITKPRCVCDGKFQSDSFFLNNWKLRNKI